MSFPKNIGVIHLLPLPGSPQTAGKNPVLVVNQAGERAMQEALILKKAGFDAIIVENFGDSPFFKSNVPRETIASFSIILAALRETIRIPIGVNVLRNDAFSALALATVVGCEFIRVNVLTGVSVTDQGLIEGQAAELLRERERLLSTVAIFADVNVKHAKSLGFEDWETAIEDVLVRAHADAVIVTGKTTGRAIDLEDLKTCFEIAQKLKTPLVVGSGATPENYHEMAQWSDGIIVGSCLREGGRAGAPLDRARLKKYVTQMKIKPVKKTKSRSKKVTKINKSKK